MVIEVHIGQLIPLFGFERTEGVVRRPFTAQTNGISVVEVLDKPAFLQFKILFAGYDEAFGSWKIGWKSCSAWVMNRSVSICLQK